MFIDDLKDQHPTVAHLIQQLWDVAPTLTIPFEDYVTESVKAMCLRNEPLAAEMVKVERKIRQSIEDSNRQHQAMLKGGLPRGKAPATGRPVPVGPKKVKREFVVKSSPDIVVVVSEIDFGHNINCAVTGPALSASDDPIEFQFTKKRRDGSTIHDSSVDEDNIYLFFVDRVVTDHEALSVLFKGIDAVTDHMLVPAVATVRFVCYNYADNREVLDVHLSYQSLRQFAENFTTMGRFQFNHLSPLLVKNMGGVGFSEQQIIGAEHFLDALKPEDKTASLKHLIDGVHAASGFASPDMSILQERSTFQNVYRKKGDLAHGPDALIALQTVQREMEAERVNAPERRRVAVLDKQLREHAQADEDEKRRVRQAKTQRSLKKLRDLPDDFTFEDL